MARRLSRLRLVLAILLLVLCPIAESAAQDEKASVAVVVGTVDGSLPQLGISEGIFKKYGIDLSLVAVKSGPELIAAVTSGTSEFAEASPLLAVPAILKGAPILFLMNVYDLDYSLVARNDSGVDTSLPYPQLIQGLKGKRIGVTGRGGVTELFVKRMLAAAGLNPNTDATIIAVGAGVSAVAAFQNNQVDAMVNLPPMEFILGQGNYKLAVSNKTAREVVFGPDFILTTMTVNKAVAQAKPGMVLNYCKAVKETIDFVRDPQNEGKMAAFLSKYMNLSMADAAAMAQTYKGNFTSRLTPERWAAFKALNNDTPAFETQIYKPCVDLSVQ